MAAAESNRIFGIAACATGGVACVCYGVHTKQCLMSIKIYHRLATGKPNQDFHTAISQVTSREIWGQRAFNGSAFACVRAFPGPLPDGKDGVEFSTSVPPTRGASTPMETYWKLHEQSPEVMSAQDGDFARIKATILRVRYSSETNLKPRNDWRQT